VYYLPAALFSTDLDEECYPAVEAEVSDDVLAKGTRDSEVTADAVDSHVGVGTVLVVRRFIVDV